MDSVNNIPLKKRRLDSFAWILQGDSTCAACYFDKDDKKLLFATNYKLATNAKYEYHMEPEEKRIINKAKQDRLKTQNWFNEIKAYLQKISDISYKMSEYLSSDETLLPYFIEKGTDNKMQPREIKEHNLAYIKKYNQLKKQCNKEMEDFLLSAENSIKLLENKDYKSAFCKAVKKLTKSIRHSYLYFNSNKSLDIEVVTAIKDGKMELIAPENYKAIPTNLSLHAEMILIEYLFNRARLKNNTEFYIGISKPCCLNCEIAIKAINSIYGLKMSEDKFNIKENEEINIHSLKSIYYRNNHGYVFPCICPKFLLNNKNLQQAYIKIFKQYISDYPSRYNNFTFKNKNNVVNTLYILQDITNIQDMFKLGEIEGVPGDYMLHAPSISDGTSNISDESFFFRRKDDKRSIETAITDHTLSPEKQRTPSSLTDDLKYSEIEDNISPPKLYSTHQEQTFRVEPVSLSAPNDTLQKYSSSNYPKHQLPLVSSIGDSIVTVPRNQPKIVMPKYQEMNKNTITTIPAYKKNNPQ